MKNIAVKNSIVPSKPRSGNYPLGSTVVKAGFGEATVINQEGESVDILKKDDSRLITDSRVMSALRAMDEFISKKNDSNISVIVDWLKGIKLNGKELESVIQENDSEESSDSNILSSLRTLKEIAERSLSKKNADQAAEIIDFLKGWTVNGDKASIDKDGNATVQQLIALVKAQVAALEVTGNTKTDSLDVTETAKAKDVEVSNSVTTLNAIIQALAKTHDLTVENTADIMNGIIRQYLSSESFVSGFLGSGFKIWKDEQGLWHGELDELTVRKTFLVFELVVQKIVHQGGMVIRSAAGGKLKKVTDGGTYWKCEHDSTDDFVVGDQVLCQTFTGTSMKRYWRLVTSAGVGYFNLSKSDCEASSANPEAGDEVAILGNRTVTARQKAQIDCAVGDDAPYRDDYLGINSYSLVRKLVCRSGNCAGIVDEVFGALDETVNFYGKGVRLRGSFALESSGKLVEDEISGQISNVRTELEVTAGQISSKVTEATTAAKNADSSATLAQGYASTAGQKASAAAGSASDAANILTVVTQKETSINQTADVIELKAVRAESAAGRAESAEASINLKADGIVLQASNQAAKAAVDGVQVGGSNLIRNGSKFTSTAYWELYNTTGVTIEYSIWNNVWSGYVPALTIHLDSFTSGEVGIYQDIATEIGQQYAFSCYIAGHRSRKVISIHTVGSSEITRWDAGHILGGNSIAEWQKPELVFTAISSSTRIYIGIPYYTDKDEYIWLKDIVLVKGNKPSGWSVSPEDVSQDATNKANAVKTYTDLNFASLTVMNDAISGLASKTVTNGLESRLTSAEAKITSDAINLTVKSQTQSLIANNAEQSITQTLDLTGLDNNTYYPVTVYVDPYITSVIQVKRGLYGMQNAGSYATHGGGFALLARWSTNGAGWGAIAVRRTFYNAEVRFVSAWPIGNIGQNEMASYEHFYLRGGSTYDITLIGKGISNLWLHTSEYRWGDDTYNYTLPLLSSLSSTPEVTYKTVAEIQAGINIVAGGISIFGQELSLAGKVTFSSLTSDAQNKITTAQSTADAANSTASSALASAGTANSGLNNLRNSLGALAYENTVSLAKLDTTIIEGGYIKTSLINANAIITNDLLATKIAATDITTRRLTVGEGCMVGGFSIGSGRIGISASPENIGNAGMFLYADMIGFNSTNRQAIVGTYSVLGYPRLGQFIDTTSNYMPNVGLMFDINSTNNGGRNYAFVGRGNGVLNGFMCGYAFQELSFTKANQWQEISKLTSVVGIYGNYNNWAVVLPTFASVCDALNISYNTPFQFQITVFCTAAVDSGKFYGRSNSGISGISGNQYPALYNWNADIDDGGFAMGPGDSFQIVLWSSNSGTSSIPANPGSYRAYIVNKLS